MRLAGLAVTVAVVAYSSIALAPPVLFFTPVSGKHAEVQKAQYSERAGEREELLVRIGRAEKLAATPGSRLPKAPAPRKEAAGAFKYTPERSGVLGFRPPPLTTVPVAEGTRKINRGFLYLKPHANTGEARIFLEKQLRERGVHIEREGEVNTSTMLERGIVERHYGSIAKRAYMDPRQLVLQPKALKAFKEAFGLDWQTAIDRKLVYNAPEALAHFNVTDQQLDDDWSQLVLGETKLKLGSGFYCGLMAGIFVINGFYMAMRSTYTKLGRSVRWYFISWKAEELRWRDFRRDVLGHTDPALANVDSLRGYMKKNFRKLRMDVEPHLSENCVHASASPFEASVEKQNWTGMPMEEDEFTRDLLEEGLPPEVLKAWSEDPLVNFDGRPQSTFDLLEDYDSDLCIKKIRKMAAVNDVCIAAGRKGRRRAGGKTGLDSIASGAS